MLLVNQIIPFSNVDGDGNRCSIFLQGCNIHCAYCHNSETISVCNHCGQCTHTCPAGALFTVKGQVVYDEKRCIHCDRCIQVCPYHSTPKARDYTIEELMTLIYKYRPYIRGITVSGGEPTLQTEGIVELFKNVGSLGLTRYVDTNGFIDLSKETELLSVTDGFLFDVKALKTQHELCEASSDNVTNNLQLLAELDKLAEVRTVVFDGLVDAEDVIMEVAHILRIRKNTFYRLIRGHLTGLRDEQKEILSPLRPSAERMERLRELAMAAGLSNVTITL